MTAPASVLSVWEFLQVTHELRQGEIDLEVPIPKIVATLEVLGSLASLEGASQ